MCIFINKITQSGLSSNFNFHCLHFKSGEDTFWAGKKSISFAGNLRKLLSLVKEYKTLYVEKFNRKYNYYSIINSFKTSKVNAKTIKERFEPGNSLLVIFSHSQVALRVCLCSHFMFDLHSRKYNQFYILLFMFSYLNR